VATTNDRIAATTAETRPRATPPPAHLQSGPLGRRLAQASVGQGQGDHDERRGGFIRRALGGRR
jgi:hypothetical protein